MQTDIYHSVYTQYVAQMNQLKAEVGEVLTETMADGWKRDRTLSILSLIDETIYTASAETFLPSGELLDIVRAVAALKEDMGMGAPAAPALFKSCFKTLNEAATTLRRISDDAPLRTALEISAREMR